MRKRGVPIQVIPAYSGAPDHMRMDNKAVRKRNVEWLVAREGGPTAFARRVQREQIQVSQWLGSKPIGDRLARHIEACLGQATGWLDAPQWRPELHVSEPRQAYHAMRWDPLKIAITTRALGIVLGRRGATLDLTNPLDAELFAEAYAELEAMPATAELEFGAVVADLVQQRGEHDGARGQPAGQPDRGKTGTAAGRGPAKAAGGRRSR